MLLAVLPGPVSVRWLLLAISLLVLAGAAVRGSAALATGLVVLLLLNLGCQFSGEFPVFPRALPSIQIWATVLGSLAAAAVLCGCGTRQFRSQFLAAALAILAGCMATICALLLATYFTEWKLYPWALSTGLIWVVIETYRRGPRHQAQADIPWKDTFLLPALLDRRTRIAILFSAVGALLVSLILYQGGNPDAVFWIREIMIAALFAACTAALRSPSMAVAGAVCLVIAQAGHLGQGDHLAFPLWSGLLVLSTLSAGATFEWFSRHGPTSWTSFARRALEVGGWYGALATLGLGARILNDWSMLQFNQPSLALACQLLIALPVAAIGVRFRLPATAMATGALVAWVLLASLFQAYEAPAFRSLLHVAAIFVAVQTILLERILSRLRDDGDPDHRIAGFRLRQAYVLGGAVFLVCAFHWSIEIRDAWTTLGWSVAALLYLSLGFLFRFSTYRRVALVMFLASIARIIAIDMAGLAPLYRISAFLALGACLVGASFLYSRYRDEIQKWL